MFGMVSAFSFSGFFKDMFSSPITGNAINEGTDSASNSQPIIAKTIQSESSDGSSVCLDSDSGVENGVPGSVIVSTEKVTRSYIDKCTAIDAHAEYYCKAGKQQVELSTCKYGCINGACLTQEQQSAITGIASKLDSNLEGQPQEPSSCGSYELTTPLGATASSQFKGYTVNNAFDNDAETHWYGNPEEAYPKWIYFDLGSVKCVNGLDLNVFIWDVPLTLDFQTSNDAINWKTVGEPQTITEGGKFEHFNLPETTTRYVRVHEINGKRGYGTLSEIKFNTAIIGEPIKQKAAVQIKNTVGDSTPDKFYEINGRRVYIEIDGQPVEDYFG